MHEKWKLLKKLFSGYNEHQEPSGGDDKCIPIFAHKSTVPVGINKGYVDLLTSSLGQEWDPSELELKYPENKYSYFVSVIKKNIYNFNFYWVKIVIKKENGEEEPIRDERTFETEDEFNFLNYVCVPSRIFNLKEEHKDVILFDGKEMTESRHEEILKEWMEQK